MCMSMPVHLYIERMMLSWCILPNLPCQLRFRPGDIERRTKSRAESAYASMLGAPTSGIRPVEAFWTASRSQNGALPGQPSHGGSRRPSALGHGSSRAWKSDIGASDGPASVDSTDNIARQMQHSSTLARRLVTMRTRVRDETCIALDWSMRTRMPR